MKKMQWEGWSRAFGVLSPRSVVVVVFFFNPGKGAKAVVEKLGSDELEEVRD